MSQAFAGRGGRGRVDSPARNAGWQYPQSRQALHPARRHPTAGPALNLGVRETVPPSKPDTVESARPCQFANVDRVGVRAGLQTRWC